MTLFKRLDSYFNSPLGWMPRLLLIAAVVISLFGFSKPLWFMEFEAQMYQDPPLRMEIYLDHLEGGDTEKRDDIKEINSLNHYIGMKTISEDEFLEFLWLPVGLGAVLLVLARSSVLGDIRSLVDATAVYAYYGGFSFYSFYRWMYDYGHNLDPKAPIDVEPFMPPLFATEKIANFTITSVPAEGTYYLTAGAGLTVIALLWASVSYTLGKRREGRKEAAAEGEAS